MERRRRGRGLPRRRTDRIEDAVAVLLCALGVVAMVLAGLVGAAAHGAVSARAFEEAADRSRVLATVTDSSAGPAVTDGVGPGTRRARAIWTAPDGAPRSGVVTVPMSATTGSAVPVWTDRSGTPVPAPTSPRAGLLVGVVAAGWVALAAVLLLLAAWRLVRRWTARRNDAEWTRRWAEVEPEWSGRAPAG
ncbi:Rv1733c family protein [Pseudonocardia yuanmonensis]|uniref:Rv1733c family protein n=1 Tax=Pseudonocardia yuanmonensis TaxID=1095914 RepID=UPI0031F0A65C